MVIAIIDDINHQLFIEFADEQLIQDKNTKMFLLFFGMFETIWHNFCYN